MTLDEIRKACKRQMEKGMTYLREELDGAFADTSREGYRVAQDISSYSLTALARATAPLMEEGGGSIVTLSYLGGERVVLDGSADGALFLSSVCAIATSLFFNRARAARSRLFTVSGLTSRNEPISLCE